MVKSKRYPSRQKLSIFASEDYGGGEGYRGRNVLKESVEERRAARRFEKEDVDLTKYRRQKMNRGKKPKTKKCKRRKR